jgi:excisionase family DNA binding protein
MLKTESTIDTLLKAGELARRLNCGKSTVYRLAQEGRIPAIGIGQTGVRFSLPDVLEALKRGQK